MKESNRAGAEVRTSEQSRGENRIAEQRGSRVELSSEQSTGRDSQCVAQSKVKVSVSSLDCRAGESAVRRVIVKLEQVRGQSGEAGAGGE